MREICDFQLLLEQALEIFPPFSSFHHKENPWYLESCDNPSHKSLKINRKFCDTFLVHILPCLQQLIKAFMQINVTEFVCCTRPVFIGEQLCCQF